MIAARVGSARHVYYLDGDLHRAVQAIGVVAIVAGVVLSAAFLWILQSPDFGPLDLFFGVLPALVLFPIGVAVFATLRSIRLVLTPDEIDFRALRYRVRGTWSEVESWAFVNVGPLSGMGVCLRGSPGFRLHGSVFAAIAPWALVTGRLPLMDRVVPFAPFAIPLRGSRLEADLAEVAPHLLVNGRIPTPSEL